MIIYTDYYVYAYLRKDLKTPYYIGKGRNGRAYNNRRKGAKPPKNPDGSIDYSRIRLFMQNMTEDVALEWEKHFIASYGRKDLGTGVLYNRTDGGEGISGVIRSEETRKKISEARKGEKHPMFGKTLSEEHRKKMSEALKGRHAWNKGKTLSEETKKKISEAMKGKKKVLRLKFL